MTSGEKDQAYQEFLKFLKFSDSEFDELITKINNQQVKKSIGDFLESSTGLESHEKKLIDSLYYLVLLNKLDTINGYGLEEYISFLYEKIFGEDQKLSPDEISLLEEKKDKILSIRNLKAIATANTLLFNRRKEIIDHKVITSIKPIFYDRAKPFELCGSVITNEMRISYRDNGKMNEISFAINTQKLETMKSIIERAIEKNNVLIKALETDDNFKIIN